MIKQRAGQLRLKGLIVFDGVWYSRVSKILEFQIKLSTRSKVSVRLTVEFYGLGNMIGLWIGVKLNMERCRRSDRVLCLILNGG